VRRVLIVRHGQSEWNAEKRWQGWIDIPLTGAGEAQATARGKSLAQLGITVPVVFSSDLSRASRTAELLAAELGARVVTDDRLRERHGGEWQGHTAAEIDERWPGLREQWRRGDAHPPGAEYDEQVLARFDGAMRTIATATSDGYDAIIVTHGGVLRLVSHRSGVDGAAIVENVGGHWFAFAGGALTADEPLPPLAADGATLE
jgi:broad specificity phosphatase PhoE